MRDATGNRKPTPLAVTHAVAERVNTVHSWCKKPPARLSSEEDLVEVAATVLCPFCGQRFDIVIDTSESFQRLAIDCEVCCRPLEVSVECEPGEILSLEVVPN